MQIWRHDWKLQLYISDFLCTFRNEKLVEYVEPTRSGTPKGEPIGFMMPKYHAALMSMTGLDNDAISIYVGVSSGLIRKWKSEHKFNELVDELVEEFKGRLMYVDK